MEASTSSATLDAQGKGTSPKVPSQEAPKGPKRLLPIDSEEGPQTVVLLGNENPQMQVVVRNPQTGEEVGVRTVNADHLKSSVTRVEMWSGFDDHGSVEHTTSTDNDRYLSLIHRTLPDEHKRYAVGIAELEQVLGWHSAGTKPSWVKCSDDGFAQAISHFYGCPVYEPVEPTMLLTNGGRDALHAQTMSTSAQPASFNYMALANNATAVVPAATDTTLVGEITTGGGGLIRAQATYAHTTGTNSTTLTKTFTANGSDSLPVTISQDGILNASSSGTLGYKDALNANATLNVSGDNITVTHTVNIG